MNIERARKKDFAELMDLMHRAFATDRPGFEQFEEMFPDLYRLSSSAMQNIFVIRADGRIASAAGLFPITLAIGPTRLRVAGIGGVCTAPEHRGKGGMTALISHILRQAREDGFALAWLSGQCTRYRRFGFERAGSALALRIAPSHREQRPLPWVVTQNKYDSECVAMLISLRSTLRVRGLCDDDTLRLKLARKHVEIWTATLGPARAYLIVHRTNKWCLEWGGDVEGVRALLLHLASGGQPWFARLPPLRDEYTDMLLSLSEQYEGAQDCVAVLNTLSLFKEYRPFLKELWPQDKSLHVIVEDAPALSVALAGGRVVRRPVPGSLAVRVTTGTLPRLLFGPVSPDVAAAIAADGLWLRQVFPLPFAMPGLWRV